MSASTFKGALVALLATALAADRLVQVSYGVPGATVVPDAIAVRDSRVEPDGEEEMVTVEVTISCYVGGGPEAQQVATERAFVLLAAVKAAIDAAPTVSGSCRVAVVADEYQTGEAIGYDQTGNIPMGRLSQIDATVTGWTGRALLGSLANTHARP